MHRWATKLKRFIRGFILISLVTGLLFFPGAPANAATRVVTTNADSGTGSLRAVIASASSGDTITFDASLAGKSINLLSTLLINKSLIINGLPTAPGIAISGNNMVRVLNITGATVTLNNLTIQNGKISTFTGQGAGINIYSGATVVLNNSSVVGNQLNNSNNGGGIVMDASSRLTLNNVTVSGNSAPNSAAGGILSAGTLIINNSTITNNTAKNDGGGLESTGITQIRNTIIAGNSSQSGAGQDCFTPLGGVIQSYGYNMIRLVDSLCTIVPTANPGTDSNGYYTTEPIPGPDPMLSLLQDNGGPTRTHLLLPGSPAIDAIPGCNGASPADQRGISRPQGASCDIGSVEVEIDDPPSVILSSTASSPTRTSPIPLVLTFSEPVTGLGESDIMVANGTIQAGSLSGSGASYTASILPAASGTVTIFLLAGAAVDSGGKGSLASAPFSIIFDNSTPVVSIDDVSPGLTRAGTRLTWHASENGAYNLRVGGTNCAGGTMASSGTYTTSPAAVVSTLAAADLAEGTNALWVCLSDAAGNAGAAVGSVIKDTLEPETSFISTPASLTRSASSSFTFSGDDGSGSGIAGYECALDGGTYATCASPFTTPSVADGEHSLSVRAVDGAGNPDTTPAAFAWVIDTTAPETTITSFPTNPASSSSATFTFSGADALTPTSLLTFECALDGGVYAACTSPQTLFGLPDGSHTLQVRAKDEAGNIDLTPAAYTWLIDATPPVVSSIRIDDLTPTRAASVSFTVTFSETVTGVDAADLVLVTTGCSGAAITAVSGSQATYTVTVSTGTGDGTIRLDVIANASIQDAANGPLSGPYTGGESYTIDRTAPDTSILSGPSNPTSSTLATFRFTGSDNLTAAGSLAFACALDGGAFATCTSPADVGSLAAGYHTYQVRAMDALGNVDATPVAYTWLVDSAAPTITSIVRVGTSPTRAASVDYRVSFDKPVSGVDPADFVITPTGGVTGVFISSISGTDTTYTITVATGTGDGTLRLDLVAVPSIHDAAGNALAGPYTGGEVYELDRSAPVVTITRAGASPTAVASVDFAVTFNEPVINLDLDDFTLTNSGLTGAALTALSGSGASYIVTVNTGSGNGTLRLDVLAAGFQDEPGNVFAAPYTTGEVYVLDRASPTVSITRADPNPTNAASIEFTLTFNKAISGLDLADLALTSSGVTGAKLTALTPVSAAVYRVTASTGAGSGTLRLDIAAGASIQDLAGNPLSAPFTGGESYTLDRGAPLVVTNGIIGLPENLTLLDQGSYITHFNTLKVTFNKALYDPAGNADEKDVTNPANYLLLQPGINQTFDTPSCAEAAKAGGVVGDDRRVAIRAVSYDSATYTATLALAAALPDGQYRLSVCGTTSIVDLAGNPLNGGQADTHLVFKIAPLPQELPVTGFAPGVVTTLPAQPSGSAYLDLGDLWLELPRLGLSAPIVGVPNQDGWDIAWLGGRVGWLNGSAYPTWAGNSVLTGHLFDANGKPGPFASLGQLTYGDQVLVHLGGQQYIYEVRETQQVTPEATAAVFKHQDQPWLTLVTCRGYDPVSQTYQSRLIVRAVLVKVK